MNFQPARLSTRGWVSGFLDVGRLVLLIFPSVSLGLHDELSLLGSAVRYTKRCICLVLSHAAPETEPESHLVVQQWNGPLRPIRHLCIGSF